MEEHFRLIILRNIRNRDACPLGCRCYPLSTLWRSEIARGHGAAQPSIWTMRGWRRRYAFGTQKQYVPTTAVCHATTTTAMWNLNQVSSTFIYTRYNPLLLQASSQGPPVSAVPVVYTLLLAGGLSTVRPAPFGLFSAFGAVYKIQTYLLTYLLTCGVKMSQQHQQQGLMPCVISVHGFTINCSTQSIIHYVSNLKKKSADAYNIPAQPRQNWLLIGNFRRRGSFGKVKYHLCGF